MKKVLSAILCVVLLVGILTACGKNTSNDNNGNTETKKVSLKVWGSQDDQEFLKKAVDNFKAQNNSADWDITFAVVGEDKAQNEVLKDVSAAADVFCFASDQITELHKAGALYRITRDDMMVKSRNTEESIKAATIEDNLYAYPSSADTCFLYYDKSKLTEDEVKTLESIMFKDLGDNVTNFAMKINDGWYNSSFFFTAGCTLFGEDGKDPTKCDFNNENGVMAAEYMIDLASNEKFKNFDDAKIKAGFASGTLASAVSGSWNANDIRNSLGENFGVAKLPSIKLNDENKQLVTMSNFKFYGVNAQTKHPEEAMDLANYLTGEDVQKLRVTQKSYAPTNKTLIADEKILNSNEVVRALTLQTQNSVLQTSIPQITNFWTPAEAFGTGVDDGSITKTNVKAKLDEFVKSIISNIS